ncbi:hypothetical protein BDV40DRAFT_290378 [Aspergillus tamarii]|uniref:Uncharacterized protein n=1 Tax=Aspergillus tamarii TaxID=41984 RepID=A0A5N6UNF2_ASPTM|nr:hypothetical protein BDV40DRAFT_290378 [Aspergillus tamarii]
MYRPTQRSQEGTQLACFHRGPFNWSHIIGNGDVICIFERHAMPAPLYSKTLLKVIRDHDILEHIDITHLLREAMGQPQSSQHGQTKPIFAVVVKLPCLAVKYPEGNGYGHRVNTLNSYSLPRFSGSESAFTSKKRPSISQTAGKETVFNIAATTFYHLTHRRRI